VGDVLRSFAEWLRAVGKWWWAAVVGLALGGVALAQAVEQLHLYLPWVLVVALAVALVGSFFAYHGERQRRITAQTAAPVREVAPPGGAAPHVAPVDYQVRALRQIIAKLSETLTEFDYTSLDAVLMNHQRTGTDAVYEPLHPMACQAGLARLVELGELEGAPWRWKIIKTGERP
jgi:hypothetical protein